MEKVILSIIALSELCAVHSHVQRQFHFVYELKTWSEALSYCREKYTDLVTINSEEEMKLLINMANLSKMVYSEYSHRAWIGLKHDVGSWKWSLSDPSFYKKGETEFRNWNPGEPNSALENCAIILYHGGWNDVACGNYAWPMCMNVTGQNAEFVPIPSSMTWLAGQSYCRKHYTDLASVRNMAENNKVKALIPADGYTWLGLNYDLWEWLDGSKTSFRYWKKGEPDSNFQTEACVAADFSDFGKWENWKCDFKRASICYSEPSIHVMKLKLVKQSSSLDLNDPAVMEDILKQLKQQLKDQGVSEDAILRWRKQSDAKVFHKEKKKKEEDLCQLP